MATGVQPIVELATPDVGEPVANDTAGGGLDRGGAGVGGKRRGEADQVDGADEGEDLAGDASTQPARASIGGLQQCHFLAVVTARPSRPTSRSAR